MVNWLDKLVTPSSICMKNNNLMLIVDMFAIHNCEGFCFFFQEHM